uniref:Sucrose phosphatase-like domain-containing protein n=1 Tax=Rhizophora mucronata TaxID=61149 RepID=A0A2P2IRB7_RHIMU
MRGLRCHPMYCRNSSRMQIIPLLASRAQALRYLFVRWRLNIANMFVFLGENGDTDYDEMISGAHKSIIMEGVVPRGSEELSGATDLRGDIVPNESPLVVHLSGNATVNDIADALKQVSKASTGM